MLGHVRMFSREGALRPAWRLPSHARRKYPVWKLLSTNTHLHARECRVHCSVPTAGGSSPPIDVLVMVEATAQHVKCVSALHDR